MSILYVALGGVHPVQNSESLKNYKINAKAQSNYRIVIYRRRYGRKSTRLPAGR